MTAPARAFDFRSMLQELRSNRRTQAALVAFALVLIYGSIPSWRRIPRGRSAPPPVGMAPAWIHASCWDCASCRIWPPWIAPGNCRPAPRCSATSSSSRPRRRLPSRSSRPRRRRRPRPKNWNASAWPRRRPRNSPEGPRICVTWASSRAIPAGLVGAFMKGEEPVTLVQGALVGERWKLVSILDTRAEFQNTKYPDLRMVLEAREASGGAPVNQF